MKKATPILYKRAVTFGRMNIGHSGHAQLIKMMLNYAEVANVYISTGSANNDWDLRVLLLRHLCREADIDLQRVKFVKSNNPFDAVQETVGAAEFNEAVIVLGSDQMEMARKLGEVYDCPWIINGRTNSSTQMRFFLDAEDFIQDLRHLYNGDEYSIVLAKLLRKGELLREGSEKASRETRSVAA
jgi:nicotinamide mononucleotide adenylyltransferase